MLIYVKFICCCQLHKICISSQVGFSESMQSVSIRILQQACDPLTCWPIPLGLLRHRFGILLPNWSIAVK